jgi:UDP-3-O-[3-hydroxymyristoyl] N-acetylglucosamine deacetylase
MDGMMDTFRPISTQTTSQRTLKSSITCVGTALHTGTRVRLPLLPAPAGSGIVFRRADLGIDIPARFDAVSDTRLCTQLAAPGHPEARVCTVEHLMAALAASGVDNVIAAVDGPEVPVFDGSAEPFLFLIDCAGTTAQAAPRRVIDVLRTVRVESGAAYAELRPGAGALDLAVSIDFPARIIGRQALTLRADEHAIRAELAAARTFAMRQEIEAMQAAGLALGGSLKNAIVVDGDTVMNPEGLRFADEFVRHKMLDAIGDLFLAGTLNARFVAHRTGHALNNRLLRALFSDANAWRFAEDSTRYAMTAQAA